MIRTNHSKHEMDWVMVVVVIAVEGRAEAAMAEATAEVGARGLLKGNALFN